METEIWKEISGYQGYYVSNLGRIKSTKKSKVMILKQVPARNGYLKVWLYKTKKGKAYLVHRLVATEFILNPENKPQVNHKNEVRTDNRVENLEWMTAKENINWGRHNQNVSKAKKGQQSNRKGVKLSEETKRKMSKALKLYFYNKKKEVEND